MELFVVCESDSITERDMLRPSVGVAALAVKSMESDGLVDSVRVGDDV